MGDGLWEVSSSLIVKILWRFEPEVMAEEVSGVRSLDAGCPSPSYLFLGFVQGVVMSLGVRMLEDVGGSCLGFQTQMFIQVSSSVFAQLCASLVFCHHFLPVTSYV